MKILYVISALGGGTGFHLVRMLDHMDPSTTRAEILCNGHVESLPPEHVPLHDDTSSGPLERFPLAQLRQCRSLHRLVRKTRPDVVHSYFFWPIMYGRILKRAGVIRNLVENREDQGFNLGPSDYRMLRLTSGVPDRVICVSEAVREVVVEREGLSPDRTVVVRNGVASSPPTLSGVELEALRDEFGLGPEHLVVGMVANLNRPVKGTKYFIEALPLIARQVPEARFLLVGEGAEREGLMARADELGVGDRTIFTGFRTDVDRLYSLIDVSVLTSLSEGLSITILESMSAGIPVVATRVGGNPELVDEGRTGLLVPPRDPETFAGAVVTLLRDPARRRQMGAAGLKRAREEFSLPRVAARYQELYREVTAR
ncbi:MAG: glycosyltransferase [Gemmatimonadales bacterium]|nr:MAG: glycosyltransferase [Gemmatimonadales bacterium]